MNGSEDKTRDAILRRSLRIPADMEELAKREFPHLTPEQKKQLSLIESSTDGRLVYNPCDVILKNGELVECVYIVEAKSFFGLWGAWPDKAGGNNSVSIQDIVEIHESKSRLPAKIADIIYKAGGTRTGYLLPRATGESDNGYYVFQLAFKDGTTQEYLTGKAVDFVGLPPGKRMEDIITVNSEIGYSNFDNRDGNRKYYVSCYSE
jgi:hypothetical protein